jgi:hypothetical protein
MTSGQHLSFGVLTFQAMAYRELRDDVQLEMLVADVLPAFRD